jgi:hypothetical protein
LPKFAREASAEMFLELKVLHPEGTHKVAIAAPGQTVQIGRLKHQNQLFVAIRSSRPSTFRSLATASTAPSPTSPRREEAPGV